MMRLNRFLPAVGGLLWAALACVGTQVAMAADAPEQAPAKSPSVRHQTRLLYEDHADQKLKWLDVTLRDRKELEVTAAQTVEGFPQVDQEQQKLVQMRASQGVVMVGIRDTDNGEFGSGWVVIDAGVDQEEHGDHDHWYYKRPASVRASKIDKAQGNPAHLYEYGRRFYLANDRKNGYTRIDPKDVQSSSLQADQLGRFIPGGGNHITLAVVEDTVGYSCWIDREGPNAARVDVTPIGGELRETPAYSFALPSGGIHGAIVHSSRVFFAPAGGVCWVDADRQATLKPEEVKIHHLSLGSHDDKPRRTGAFVNASDYVLCVTGKQTDTHLAMINALAEKPTAHFLKLDAAEGAHVGSPAVVTRRNRDQLAFLFHDHDPEVSQQDLLSVVLLDPNRDGSMDDAQVLKTVIVGPSAVEGHNGRHAIAFDADRRYGFITNPGDGTLSVLSLESLEIVKTFPIGGKPTSIVAVGGRE